MHPDLHSWPKATRHAYGPPQLASPFCVLEKIDQEKDNLSKDNYQQYSSFYPGGAVGHRSSAVTKPIAKKIIT